MKFIIRFLFTLIYTSTLISCCHEHSESNGVIISDFKVGTDKQTYDCLSLPDTACIRDDSTYRAVFKINSSRETCNGLVLPKIDFNKNSILIYKKDIGGRLFFHRDVLINSNTRVVTYIIATSKCFCPDKCETYDQNIVVVPKIGKEYTVRFE